MQYALMQASAERVSFDLRTRYLSALLNQEVAFFEKQQIEALPSQIAEYFRAISEGVGEKTAQFVYAVSMFLGGLTIAFYYGPIFTFIMLAYLPIMVLLFAVFGRAVKSQMALKLTQTEILGAHTEETLSALKLVVSFAQEDFVIEKYDKIAEQTKNQAKKASIIQSSVNGLFLAFMFGFFLYSYAAGSWLIQNERTNPATGEVYKVSEIISVAQATMMSMMTFGQIFPVIPAIIKSLIVGKKVLDVIDRVPEIVSPKAGAKSDSAKISIDSGIHFQNAHFRYPTAPEGSRDVF